MSCGLGCRRGLDLVWLWLCLAAVAPIQPLAWELTYATGVALKSKKKKKNQQKPTKNFLCLICKKHLFFFFPKFGN